VPTLQPGHLESFLRTTYGENVEDRRRTGWNEQIGTIRAPEVALVDGEVIAALWLYSPDETWWVSLSRPNEADRAHVRAIALDLLKRAREHGLRELRSRQPARTSEVFTELGFSVTNRRVEYKRPVAELPNDTTSPFEWRAHTDLPMNQIAAIIEQAGAGPEWEETDSGRAIASSQLDELAAPEALQIGFLDGEPAAFVLPFVEASSGWATLKFLGLAPRWRGKGLGGHVHRHGFAMLQALGGIEYHGGTSAENLPMRRLFETHGCAVHLELFELYLQL
jgi:GNAT superfamily N-acetyltransferase